MSWLIWLIVGLGPPHVVLLQGWYPPLPPAPPSWQGVSFHGLEMVQLAAFCELSLPTTSPTHYAHQFSPTTLALPMAWHHHYSTTLAWHSLYHSPPNGMPHHGLLHWKPLTFCSCKPTKNIKAPTTAPHSFTLKNQFNWWFFHCRTY
jgi:hypothetical protein